MEDTATGAGELATKKRSVGFNKSTQRAIHHKNRCKETFRKGKATTSPKEKENAKEQSIPRKVNHNQDQAGSPDEDTGQRKLNDFAI